MQAETTIYFVVWWVLFEYSSFDHFRNEYFCSKEYIESPGYSSGYYFSDDCKPSDSEWRIFRRFKNRLAYPPTVREAVRDVKEGEADHEDGTKNNLSCLCQS